MGGGRDEEAVAGHLEVISPDNYRRQKIQKEISDLIDNAALSAEPNILLLKDLQKLNAAFENYNLYIDMHVQKIISFLDLVLLVEKAKKRRDADNKALMRTFIPQKQESAPDGFMRATDLKKKE